MTQHMSISAGRKVSIITTHIPDNADAITAAGFRYSSGAWSKEASSPEEMMQFIREALDLGGILKITDEKMIEETVAAFGEDIPILVGETHYYSIADYRAGRTAHQVDAARIVADAKKGS